MESWFTACQSLIYLLSVVLVDELRAVCLPPEPLFQPLFVLVIF
jgi:hypothetical protein